MTSELRSVLVVEPSPTFGRKVVELCTTYGARVDTRTTLAGAIDSIENDTPDALIVARVLGDLPGESLVAALRASPLHQHLAIAILSSNVEKVSPLEAARPDRVIARDANLGNAVFDFLSNAFEAPDAAASMRELSVDAASGSGDLQGRRVLVVDDMESTRRLLNLLLTRRGAEVTLSESGPQAAELIAESAQEPDLVLMDYEMPEHNGVESLAILRERGYQGPALLCSGHDDPEFAQLALDQGFCGVVPKAQAHSELHTRCARAMRKAA